MTEAILEAAGLVKRFGALTATDGLSLRVERGTVHALIGPNGAGKTTAIAQLSGEMSPDAGTVRFDGVDVTRRPVHARARSGLVRSYQITSVFKAMTAEDNVALAIQAREAKVFRLWRSARDDIRLRGPARQVLEYVGLAGRENTVASALAHGEQRQLELAMALATEPRMLLLDEPMAGMGPEETRRMVGILRPLKGRVTMLLVEHDMDVVFALADRVTVLVLGKTLVEGAPEEIRADERVRRAYLGEGR